MLPQSENAVVRCASSLRQRHPSNAENMVRQQIGWSQERKASREVEFWSAVLKRLEEADLPVARIHVLKSEGLASRLAAS